MRFLRHQFRISRVAASRNAQGVVAGNAQGGVAGNALFLILIGVALFAALSYAITRSGAGGSKSDAEQAQLAAAQISQFFGAVEQAFTRLRLRGCPENQLTIENDVFIGGIDGPFSAPGPMIPVGTNTNSPADGSCHIFHPNGGGVAPYVIKGATTAPYNASGGPGHSVWWGWARPGNPFFTSQVVPGVGTTAADIVASMLYVPEKVCKAFAAGIGTPTPVLHSEMGDWTDTQFTDGTYPNSFGGGWGAGMTPGTSAWCMDGQDPGSRSGRTWHIYYVVYAR